MLLAVDIGNSNIVLGLYDAGTWVHTWRLLTDSGTSAITYEKQIRQQFVDSGIELKAIKTKVLSSVVPSLTPVLEAVLVNLFLGKPIIVGPSTYSFLSLAIDNPAEIGTDLVANAVAAYTLYQRDCIVVDFGTALTFTTVEASGKILGVAIAPGLITAMKALFGNTAQLPEVPLELPDSVVGKNTIHAIQSGILWGYVGMVRQMIQKTRAELGEHYIAIATGGLSSILHPLQADFYAVVPHLTLEGLRIIAEKVLENKA
jgi:type III pantothenate kinase